MLSIYVYAYVRYIYICMGVVATCILMHNLQARAKLNFNSQIYTNTHDVPERM